MMENRLNLISNLSLNEMTIRRVVINLWSEYDVSFAFQIPKNCYETFCWRSVENEVREKISKLWLPKTLKKRMMDLVKPVRTEVMTWKLYHENLLKHSFNLGIFKHLFWSCTGAIDYQKTAEKLVCLKMLSIKKLYRLACWYCLEDYIPVLWGKLSEKYKRRFNKDRFHLQKHVDPFEYYWSVKRYKLDILPREYVNVSSNFRSSPYQSYFLYSAVEGSKAATEYFFQKLTDNERDDALRRTQRLCLQSDGKIRSDVLFYLLSLMNYEQQMQVFQNHPTRCLMCLLDWPRQDLFLDIADLIWNFLPEDDYDYVLRRMFDNMFVGKTSYYLPDFFQKFFICSPINFRSRCATAFLSNFVLAEDAETVRIVFRNLDSSNRIRFLSSSSFSRLLFHLMSDDRWHLVELCVGEATLSKEDREVLKDIFIRFSETDCSDVKRKRFLELLDGTSLSANSKKSSDDEALTKAKRPSSEEESYNSTKKLRRYKKPKTY